MKFKKYAKYLGVATLAFGFATGCQSTGTSSNTSTELSANDQVVQSIITDAKAALADAKKEGYAWRDTGKFIKQAEKALADGNTAKATSLATKALQQSELAKKQDAEQDKAVKERFNQS
ncbi:MAG: hypothetical protein KZQ64_04645 [gamma proteobacterium symbiont of Bathyaustriella thionipta]|nr:hypothetical protein [gamma proteobacterium symbiont of Bathyaustriella thionipta]MCU7950925.1 hypothetical protein [gamma proteobacterium symbiont of Bathyaustriella thionipta]MCU7952668.1 hypothetical protein [gamma proteobacterium symbiont of Bathyaustriella thionipta]MCU7957417.1 hypothetical protein [gamma proteobacterium symbiont of Bathyaustriella thionipta]MCU7967108.1 hypothetical protein [gamma proteobacterium symbiont of Bathyaustriella thionipta]